MILNRHTVCTALFITALSLPGCSGDAKFRQYYNQGEDLYRRYCSNCHQRDGSGLGRLYPPLSASDYMDDHFEEAICLMRHGKKGSIIVNGAEYNMDMKGVAELTDLEIAQIATYIYNTWGHERGLVDVTQASQILDSCRSK